MTVLFDSITAEFKKASRLTGIYTRLGKKLGVSPNHVRQVALGNRTSDRVMKALCIEMKRIQREVEKERAA